MDIELNFQRYLPDSYIEKNEKIKIYKRALDIKNLEELQNLYDELEDRFGKMKKEAQGFFEFLKIKLIAQDLGIVSIKQHDEKNLYINFNENKVNIDKIIFLINNKKIKYLKFTNTIVYQGNIFDFFNLYSNYNV